MLKYALKKLTALVPKMLVISIILFIGLDMIPGDPLTRTIPVEVYEELSEYQRNEMRESLGLNDPIHIRYINWLGNLLKGELGYSTANKAKIADVIGPRLPYTMELCVYGLLVSTLIGLTFGFIAALFKRTIIDHALNAVSTVWTAVPEFFVALCLLILFSVNLKWLPVGGRMDPEGGSRIPYMILPVFSLGMNYAATLVKYVRNTMLEVMDREYIKTARSKGLSETVVYLKHAFRNALIPVTILMCMRIPMLVGGFVVIEQVFSYHGIGSVQLTALNGGDIPVVMICLMLTGVLTMVASTLADLATAALDPRVRLE